jgi:hypothetical protein
MDWLIALFALLGVVLGLGYNEYRNRKEQKDRYRVITFEKRLEAHQKAYYWYHQLNRVLNIGDSEAIHETTNKAREWWDSNCLFVDANSRREMVRLMNLSHMYANDNKMAQEKIWDYVISTSKAIVLGIGFEYLPEEFSNPEELDKVM